MFLTLLASTSLTPPVPKIGGSGPGVPIWWLGHGGDMGYRPIDPRKVLPFMRAALKKPDPKTFKRAKPHVKALELDKKLVLAGLYPKLAALPDPIALFRAPEAPAYDETEDLLLLLAA